MLKLREPIKDAKRHDPFTVTIKGVLHERIDGEYIGCSHCACFACDEMGRNRYPQHCKNFSPLRAGEFRRVK